MSGRLALLLTSPRVAPGLLSRAAWQVLEQADLVVCADDAEAQPAALAEAGIVVRSDIVGGGNGRDQQRLARELVAAASSADVVWVGSPDGDPGLTDALASELSRVAARADPPAVEVLVGSHDVPGSRLLDLVAVMDRLRSPGGCPWDAEQTHASLVPYLVEEAFEAAEAIETGDRPAIREELGDVLLQVVFHARMAAEHPRDPFDVDDVAEGIITKLVRRHPHVFAVGGDAGATAQSVAAGWEDIKAHEKQRAHVLDGVPLALPALARADKVLGRIQRASTASPRPAEPAADDPAPAVGDELLDVVRRARAQHVDPEAALREAVRRLEAAARAQAVAGVNDPVTQAQARYRRTAATALDVLLELDPAAATALGDHRYDHRLPDLSAAGVALSLTEVGAAVGALDDLDDTVLEPQDLVDLELLRGRLTAMQWSLTDLAEHTWNPLVHLPGEAVHALVSRASGDPHERASALVARLQGVPQLLATARATLGQMPRVHVETAITQARGAQALLGGPVDELLGRAPGAQAEVDAAREVAAAALDEHADWLHDQLPVAERDPRLRPDAFAARLWSALDTETGPDALLIRAESDLMALEEQLAELSARLAPVLGVQAAAPDRVRAVLDAVAAGAPTSDADLLDQCVAHLTGLTELVRAHDLVTVPDALVATTEVIVMPEVNRGVAVAYCDAPGALEPGGPHPTFFAVSPTPQGWSAEQVASFHREYNGHMLRDLTAHEAMPGHVLQLAHARDFAGSTPVRAALASGVLIEGWAVYAEQLVADALEQDAPGELATMCLRLQQLKMRLRCTINAILDVRVHTRGMTQDEAMTLMTRRGHQEVGEATGKWRRALLTSSQLSTYYVGHDEVSSIAADLAQARSAISRRGVHDELLSHGSPSPRLLRGLLDLPEAPVR